LEIPHAWPYSVFLSFQEQELPLPRTTVTIKIVGISSFLNNFNEKNKD
jgi:hypothetical protein